MTPVDFPELTVDADNYEAALRVTTSKLARQLRSLSGSVRTQLSAPVVAELDRVNVTLKRPRAATVRIAVSLVVTIQETSRGLLFVLRAPEIPQFAVALQNRETVAESAKRALTGILAHWDLHEVMACDDVGETRLETVTIAFPSAEEPRLARGDDPFLLEESGDELDRPGRRGPPRPPRPARRARRARAGSACLAGPVERDAGRATRRRQDGAPARARVAARGRRRPPGPARARALADHGERADRRRDLHRHVAGPRSHHRRPRSGRGSDLRHGRPGGDPRRGPLERERQQPVALLEAVRRERRGQPDLRVDS